MSTTVTARASPDALLALASKEGRGRLKIFLGAAPGVGKTYAMLAAARSEQASGRDVVAVGTHPDRSDGGVELFDLDGREVGRLSPTGFGPPPSDE